MPGEFAQEPTKKGTISTGRFPELVRCCINVTALSLAGMLTGAILFQANLFSLLFGFEMPQYDLMIHGAEIGAFAAVLVTRIPIGARIPIAAGMAAETFGRTSACPEVGRWRGEPEPRPKEARESEGRI